eukprot:297429-Rhodomonas_salina.1
MVCRCASRACATLTLHPIAYLSTGQGLRHAHAAPHSSCQYRPALPHSAQSSTPYAPTAQRAVPLGAAAKSPIRTLFSSWGLQGHLAAPPSASAFTAT